MYYCLLDWKVTRERIGRFRLASTVSWGAETVAARNWVCQEGRDYDAQQMRDTVDCELNENHES